LKLRDDHKIGLMSALLLIGLTLVTGIMVYEVMKTQVESSLGKALQITLQEDAHHLIAGLEDAKEDTHAAASRPFLIKALYQISVAPGSVIDLQNLKLNIDSLLEAGFTAASAYDIHGKELLSTGNFIRDLEPSFSLINDTSITMAWDSKSKSLFVRVTESVLNSDGHQVGSIQTEKNLKDLKRTSTSHRRIGSSGEFMLCQPLKNNSFEMKCLLSRESGIEFKQLSRIVNSLPLPMDFALNGKTGIINAKDYRQIPVVAAYQGLRNQNIGMVLKIDEKELYESANKRLYDIALYTSLMAALGWVLLYWLVLPVVRRLTKSEQQLQAANTNLQQSESNLRNLMAYQESIKEEERQRIARDIHDQMGSDLSGINSHLAVSIDHSQKNGLTPDPHIVSASELAVSAINSMRNTINELRPPILKNFGIWETLRWHCGQIEKRENLQCELVIDELTESIKIGPDLSTSIFRMTQESITNVIRHAKASRITIHARVQDGIVTIEISDDGIGIPIALQSNQNSMGIIGMRERCLLHQGSIEIKSTPEQGTTVVIQLPIGDSLDD
jgi:signal transduction histidine kinase